MEQVIYKIINVVNNKFYVGSTTNKKVRFRQHRNLLRGNRHHCKHLQASWNKYGEDKFEFVVVEIVSEGMSLQQVEDIYLLQHVGQPMCYNSGYSSDAPWRNAPPQATPNFGKVMAQQQKEKISEALKEFYAADYFNHPRVGKKHTEETKLKIKQNRVPAAGESHYRYGKTLSDETKAKIGAAQRGKPKAEGRKVSKEGLLKIRENIESGRSHKHWIGRKHTEEAKEKMSKTVFVMPDGILFPSLTAVLSHYGMKMPTLRRALVSGKHLTKGRLAGYSFRYGGIDSKPTENDLALIRAKLIDSRPNN